MGLDWHTCVPVETKDKGKGVVVDGVEYTKPCKKVGAPKWKDRSTFRADVEREVSERKAEAEGEAGRPHPNMGFVAYWRKRTVEEELADRADKFDCENCPLLRELQGADSTKNLFLGVTVTSCDFRGKRISADDAIDDWFRDEAYEPHNPSEMLDYASKLEGELERLRYDGLLEKPSYEAYSAAHDADPWPLKGPKLTPEEYFRSLHWREVNIRQAIHWLRTCAKYGVSMQTSY